MNGLITQFGQRMVLAGLQGGSMTASAADVGELSFAALYRGIVNIALRAHAEQGDIFHQIVEMLIVQLATAGTAISLIRAAIGVWHHRGHYTHFAVKSDGQLMFNAAGTGFPAKASEAGFIRNRISNAIGFAGNSVSVYIMFIFHRQNG